MLKKAAGFSGESGLACAAHVAPCLDVIPSSERLSCVDVEMADKFGSEYALREALEASGAVGTYDYVVIDTPPALGKLTINALVAATELIIPCRPTSSHSRASCRYTTQSAWFGGTATTH